MAEVQVKYKVQYVEGRLAVISGTFQYEHGQKRALLGSITFLFDIKKGKFARLLCNLDKFLFYILNVFFLLFFGWIFTKFEAFMIRFSYWPLCSVTQKIGDVLMFIDVKAILHFMFIDVYSIIHFSILFKTQLRLLPRIVKSDWIKLNIQMKISIEKCKQLRGSNFGVKVIS